MFYNTAVLFNLPSAFDLARSDLPMLHSLPPSDLHPLQPTLRRRRGAPLSNRNALKHGLYAVKTSTPFTGFSISTGTYREILAKDPDLFSQVILEVREKIVEIFRLSKKAQGFRAHISLAGLMGKFTNVVVRINTARSKLQKPVLDLQFVSQHALALIRYDFRSQGITRDADLFRENLKLSDFNSLPLREPQRASLVDPAFPFLTSRQWAVLEPLLPPFDHAAGRGRPPADPREMLAAIFWKLALHARWQDLPAGYPPMLTCRRYYRRLFLSGRLATLYSALYKDLRTRGEADLVAILEKGCFSIIGKNVILRPGRNVTWQMRTALLFMQQGYRVFRKISSINP